MDISFVSSATKTPGALVVGIIEGGTLTVAANDLDGATRGTIRRVITKTDFKGKAGKVVELLAPDGIEASRILLVGLGKPEDLTVAAAQGLGAAVVRQLMTSGETSVTFMVDLPPREGKEAPAKAEDPVRKNLSEAEIAVHIAFGVALRSYRFDTYRTDLKEDQPTLKKVVVVTSERAEATRQWKLLSAAAEGVKVARDLVNEPPNVLYPDEFARRAKALAKLGVKVEILNEAQMKKLGMNMLLAVGNGSEHESRLVVLRWNGAPKRRGKVAAPIAFIGKGVCFDSGGLSLKPANSMMGMKGDMGGGAAVLGLMHALAKRKARVDAVGVIGLVENMPDGKAMRPNDIVKTMSGQTVEVLNTDAEGRLVLADALWYTQSRFKPRFMVNLATLTGAIVVALGTEHAGLFSNNDELAGRLISAGETVGETVWRMPLGESYNRLLNSKIADMKNIGGPNAGSITAAQFLQRFVNKVPWAHLDIAGVAWQDGERKALAPSWGTGWGVRLLNRFVADHYES
jgi:leucyl aminopeptidase